MAEESVRLAMVIIYHPKESMFPVLLKYIFLVEFAFGKLDNPRDTRLFGSCLFI